MSNLNLIIKPLMTEKASKMAQEGKYIFFVRKNANKTELKKIIKELYGAQVSKVNVMRTPSKTKLQRRGTPSLKRREFKKVIVSIKGKKTIDIYKVKGKK